MIQPGLRSNAGRGIVPSIFPEARCSLFQLRPRAGLFLLPIRHHARVPPSL